MEFQEIRYSGHMNRAREAWDYANQIDPDQQRQECGRIRELAISVKDLSNQLGDAYMEITRLQGALENKDGDHEV